MTSISPAARRSASSGAATDRLHGLSQVRLGPSLVLVFAFYMLVGGIFAIVSAVRRARPWPLSPRCTTIWTTWPGFTLPVA